MKDKRYRQHPLFSAALFAWVFALTGCSVPQDPAQAARDNRKTITIATWNVQALFDGVDTGREYDEYRESAGWSEEKYRARLTSIAEAVEQMGESAPDILALQEVENAGVLKDLAEGSLSGSGYGWTFFANNSGYSLGLGVLSRFPLTQAKAHSVNAEGTTAPRPVLELRLEPEGKPLALFICHWKSKVGGEEVTEASRRASARVILRRLKEFRREEPDLPVIIMGDLNENHDEFYRRSGTVVSALLPDDPKAAELSGFYDGEEIPEARDFLVISGQKPPEARHFTGTIPLYSPWGNELEKGSYNYKNEWSTIDHFLLTGAFFDGRDWEFETCEVPHREPFINGKGHPNTYSPRTGAGQSDHLPLLLTLTMRE